MAAQFLAQQDEKWVSRSLAESVRPFSGLLEEVRWGTGVCTGAGSALKTLGQELHALVLLDLAGVVVGVGHAVLLPVADGGLLVLTLLGQLVHLDLVVQLPLLLLTELGALQWTRSFIGSV